jgi:hypothetical protein
MFFPGKLFSTLKAHRATTPVVIGSSRFVLEDCRSMLLSGQFAFSLAACASDVLSSAQSSLAAQFHQALVATPIRFTSALALRFGVSSFVLVAQAFPQHLRHVKLALVSRLLHQKRAVKPVASSSQRPNPSVNRTVFMPALFLIRRCAAGYLKR